MISWTSRRANDRLCEWNEREDTWQREQEYKKLRAQKTKQTNKQTNKHNQKKKPQNPNLVCSKKSQNCSVTEGTSVFKWRIT